MLSLILKTDLPELDTDAYLSWLEIDLAAIRANYKTLRNHVASASAVYAVIKADAYGHGAVEVVGALLEAGAHQFCVARVEEAVELRQAGITSPVLVLAPAFKPQALVAARHDLAVVVCDPAHIEGVAEAQRATGRPVSVHIKTDLGMGRLGIPPAEVTTLLEQASRLGVPVDGIMAHLPCADGATFTSTEALLADFQQLRTQILARHPGMGLVFHIANSAATMRSNAAWFDAVRCGISLYGQFPSVEMERKFELRPAMTMKSCIGFLKQVEAGTPISYSHTYKTPAPARLATIPLGYADGYPRHASNQTHFLLHDKPAPQIGRVCMDQVVLDVTAIPQAKLRDEVIAFGVSPTGAELRVEDMAAQFGSIGYEVTTRVGKRLPRFYR